MYILGIACFYHDASACLLKDGKVIAAAEEERFTRKKHDSSFPKNAIEFCLKEAGISIAEIDAVSFYEKPLIKFERILYNAIATFPKSYLWFLKAIPVWLKQKLWFNHVLKKETGYKGEVYYCDHHLSHAASSYFASGFDNTAYLTVDGVGEWVTGSLGSIEDGEFKILKEMNYPHSLGLLYSVFTGYLGFRVNNGEYKVMGLASYGDPKYVDQIYKNLIHVYDDGSFKLNLDFFAFQYSFKGYNKKFVQLFGEPFDTGDEYSQRAADLAASLQKVVEEVLLKQLDYLYSHNPVSNLVLAGGVALNCVANRRIINESKFTNLFIQPAAGDSGGSVGAAYYLDSLLAKMMKLVRDKDIWSNPYFGSAGYENLDLEVTNLLNSEEIIYTKFIDEKKLIDKVAKLIAANKVVGWFQGRQEFGPRALGHRSILANPACSQMQEILNTKIKHREKFRPFAPTVLLESANKYFDMKTNDSPYMLLVADVKAEFKDKLPAITHIDGTARVQTLQRNFEPMYYDLIKAVGELTGVDIVVNTSFNVRGEPIVRTPNEALECFRKTDMDVLVLGNYLIVKE